MKALFVALFLVPQFVFGGTIFLTLTSEQGLANLKLPGDVQFESTNVFCEERGLIPQPWSAPRKQKVTPKVVSVSANSVVLEISTNPLKQDICKYRFSDYTVWSDDGAYFVSVEATNESNSQDKDAEDLELVSNSNSLYLVECLAKKNLSRQCAIYKDGVQKGYKGGNGSRLYVDMNKLDAQKEIRPSLEFKKLSEE